MHLERAVQGNIRVREQSAANLVLCQCRLLPFHIHHGIQVPMYPVDIALPLVVIHQVSHRRPFPHHLSDILQAEASQLPHPLIMLDNRKLLLLPIVHLGNRKLSLLPIVRFCSSKLPLPLIVFVLARLRHITPPLPITRQEYHQAIAQTPMLQALIPACTPKYQGSP